MKAKTQNGRKIKSLLKKRHDVSITDKEVETIEEVYSEFNLDVTIGSLYKRIIIFLFGFVVFLLFLMARGTSWENNFLFSFFLGYFSFKIIMIARNYTKFRKLNDQSTVKHVESKD